MFSGAMPWAGVVLRTGIFRRLGASVKVFISYRREDTSQTARVLHERFSRAFGRDAVFMDVDSLAAGQRFDLELKRALAECDVLIALIGPRWLDLLVTRQSLQQTDFVVEEIAASLKSGVRTIPVTCDGASMPVSTALPKIIQDLSLHHRFDLSHERFNRDVEHLILEIAPARAVGENRLVRRAAGVTAIIILSAALALAWHERVRLMSFASALWQPSQVAVRPSGPLKVGDRIDFSASSRQQVGTQSVDITHHFRRMLVRLERPAISADESPAASGQGNAGVPKFEAGRIIAGSGSAARRRSLYAALYQSLQAEHVGSPAIESILSLYVASVDFLRPVTGRDILDVLFSTASDDPGARPEELLFAALSSDEKARAYYCFEQDGEKIGYFDADGNPPPLVVRRKPVVGEEVRFASGFGVRRHPILGTAKLHAGVDWAAAVGTPIVAAAGGIIEVAEQKGEYGNYIRIKHINNIQTAYAHMQRFADGVGEGKRVMEGETIGFVGATGVASGPHLHFEVLIDDEYVDGLTVGTGRTREIEPNKKDEFTRARAMIDDLLRRSVAEGRRR